MALTTRRQLCWDCLGVENRRLRLQPRAPGFFSAFPVVFGNGYGLLAKACTLESKPCAC